MQKNFKGLIIGAIISTLFAVALFSIAYYFLSNNYIKNKNVEFLSNHVESTSSLIDSTIKLDYESCFSIVEEYINESNPNFDGEQFYNSALLKEAELTKCFSHKINIGLGYFSSDMTKMYLGKEDKEYQISVNEKADALEYIQKNVSIYKISYIASNSNEVENDISYIFFRFKDFFIYFSSLDYISYLYSGIEGLPSTYYLIFESSGFIYANTCNKKISNSLRSNINKMFDYSLISSKILNGEGGYSIVDFADEPSYFVYKPILTNIEQDLFLGYVFLSNEVDSSNEYLFLTLGALSLATVFIIAIIVFIFCYNISKRAQDLNKYNASYYFIKPFTIYVDKKGKIKKYNKSCEKNIKDFSSFRNINEFMIYEQFDDTISMLRKQDSFVVEFKSAVEDDILYAKFIPLHVFTRYILIGINVTTEFKQQIINARMASYNQVTDLPNKNVFDKDSKEIIRHPDFAKTNTSFIAVDMLEFAKINKLYGFETANIMLKNIATLIDNECKKTFHDFALYNIRTSFFIVIVKNVDNYNNVVAWARGLASDLSSPIEIRENFTISVEPKIGLVNVTDDLRNDFTSELAYDYLQKALERSKTSLLSKVSIYNAELSSSLSRDQIMEEDLRNAIANDEFIMYYQAQFNIKTNKIIGFESLLRWNNPKYKFESPEYYVTLAERNGLIIELGRLIYDKVFSFAKKIEGTGIKISLNVSPVQLLQAGFVYELMKSYDDHGIKENTIALEITETFLMENRDSMIAKLRILREKGFDIHLDDFGMGYSSLFYLKDLPVDAIKIDKEFTKYMVPDKITRVIVTKVVQMAISLNLEIICEGVETDKQRELLQRMGCEIIQGYLISKPVDIDSTMQLIQKYNGNQSLKPSKKAKIKDETEGGDE